MSWRPPPSTRGPATTHLAAGDGPPGRSVTGVTGDGEGGRGDRIQLRGLRAIGTHGVLPEEKSRAQPFEIDLDLAVDLGLRRSQLTCCPTPSTIPASPRPPSES